MYAVAGKLEQTADMLMPDAADRVLQLCSLHRDTSLEAAHSVLQKCNKRNKDSTNTAIATERYMTELHVT